MSPGKFNLLSRRKSSNCEMKFTHNFESLTFPIFLEFSLHVLVLAQVDVNTETGNRTMYMDTNGVQYSPEDFSKLSLNVPELFGSRWLLDRNESIDVYHIIAITDACLIHKNELTLRIEFTLIQRWIAPDLEFPVGLFKDSDPNDTYISADSKVLDNMWSPDSYVSSARESNLRIQGSEITNVYISRTKRVTFKSRMNSKLSCTSSFQWYPVDVQSCELIIASFRAQDNLRYYWNLENPVRLKMRRLMQYELQTPVKYTNGINSPYPNAHFPFVQLEFILARKLGNNIIQVYTPTLLVVALSWFSFWLGLDAIPGRISLLVTCMLTLVTMHGGIKNSIPPVDYITMMDVWLVSCMAMVFAAICEFVVVKYAHWRIQMKVKSEEKREEMDHQVKLFRFLQLILNARGTVKGQGSRVWRNQDNGDLTLSPSDDLLASVCIAGDEMYPKNVLSTGQSDTEKEKAEARKTPLWVSIDKLSRAVFPTLFACFNGIYWPVLLTRGTYVDEHDRAYYDDEK